MAKTINRVPFTVKTDPDIDYKFFAHGNWNGICTDKNYFNIDQETFEDANNVYIDSNGVLSSRPTVQQVLDVGGSPYTHIQRQWQFGDVIVRQLTGRKLYFYKRGNMVAQSVQPISDTAYIIENDGKLFIFDDVANRIDSYNKSATGESANEYKEGCDVYVPVKYTYTNMIKSRVAESPNILINSYIDRYLYSRPLDGLGSSVNFSALEGKDAIISMNGETYERTLSSRTGDAIFAKTLELPTMLYPTGSLKYEYVSSGGGITIFCVLNSVTVSEYKYLFNFDIYYTIDGITYTLFDNVADCLSIPRISQDGTVVGIVKDTSVLFKSTITPGETVYSEWTSVHTFDSSFYRKSSIGSTYEYAFTFGLALSIVDASNFAIVCVVPEDYSIQASTSLGKAIIIKNDTSVFEGYKYFVSNGVLEYSSVYGTYDMPPILHLRVFDNDWAFAISVNNTVTYVYETSVQGGYLTRTNPIQNMSRIHPCSFCNLPNGAISFFGVKDARIYQYYHKRDYILEDETNGAAVKYTTAPISTEQSPTNGPITADLQRSILYGLSGLMYVNLNDEGIIKNCSGYDAYIGADTIIVTSTEHPIVALSYRDNKHLYSSVINDEITIDILNGDNSIFVPKIESHNELDAHYITYVYDNKYNVAISAVGVEGNGFKWYFPENTVETFTNNIVDLYPISTNEMGVFLENEVWYIGQTESGRYTYTKSKLPLGCKKGSNVISSYDGKNLMMLTERGFVALSYQDFVASTDQVLSFLSDSIDEIFIPYIKNNICKLYKHKYWILVYSDSTTMYVYDIRNGSWWKWTLPSGVSYPITVNDEVSFVNSTLYKFTNEYEEYKDYNDNNIDWYIVSQKLHLNTLNYYKRLVNMTLNSLHAKDETQKMILSTTNYRDKSYEGLTSKPGTNNTLDYDVDLLRTYVKRLNYGKLVEFQYKLRNNERVELQPQLKLNSIIIKYVITGVIR